MLKFSAFGMLINRGEYGDQLPRFIKKVGHFCIGNTAAIHEKFEPIFGFLDFLQAIADFGNKFGF